MHALSKCLVLVVLMAAKVFAGGCYQHEGTVSGSGFSIKNTLTETIEVSQFESNALTPRTTGSITSNSTIPGAGKRIVRVCAYTSMQITRRVTQQQQLACCQNENGFSGATLEFMSSDSLLSSSSQSSSDVDGNATSHSLGGLMGY